MVFPSVEVAVAVLLILSLMVLLRLRRYIGSGERYGYNQMFLGLAILAAAAIARGHFQVGNLAGIPFVGDPLVFHLMEWMMVITGAILLVSGLSEYLPAARDARRYNRDCYRRLELIKKIDQLAAVESREPDLLGKALERITEQYRMPAGAVFRCDAGGSLNCLRAVGEYAALAGQLETVSFDPSVLGREDSSDAANEMLVSGWPPDCRPPNLMLPVAAEGRVRAVYALRTSESVLPEGDRVNLQISLDILAREVLTRVSDRRRITATMEGEWWRRIAGEIDYAAGLRANLRRMAGVLNSDMPGAALVYLNRRPDNRIDRYAVSANGVVLHESGLTADRIGPAMLDVCGGKTARLIRFEKASTSDLVGLGLCRAAAAPIRQGVGCRGAVAVAWSDEVAAPDNILERISQAAPLLEPLAVIDSLRRENKKFDGRTAALVGLLKRVIRQGDLANSLQEAAEVLASELGSSIVRISTYEADGRHLRSRGLSASRGCAAAGVDGSLMDLESMPYHRLVRDTGRPMLINQEDTNRRIEPDEARLIGTEQLRSALLVPVIVNDIVLAVLSIADLKEWHEDRWDHSSIQFANTIAHVLGLTIRMSLRRRDREGIERRAELTFRTGESQVPQPV